MQSWIFVHPNIVVQPQQKVETKACTRTLPPQESITVAIAFDGLGRDVESVQQVNQILRDFRSGIGLPGFLKAGVVGTTPQNNIGYFLSSGFDAKTAKIFSDVAKTLLRNKDILVLSVARVTRQSDLMDDRADKLKKRMICRAVAAQGRINAQMTPV